LALDPKKADAWQFKADALLLSGREKEAREVEEQAKKQA
jgi:hypothetical protein